LLAQSRRDLLSIGVLFLVIAVGLILFALNVIADWSLLVSLVLVLFGFWFVVLAGLRGSKSESSDRGAFSTMILGLLLIAIGAALYLFRFSWLYSLVLLLLVFGVLTIVTALRQK